ncbi:MAG: ABC transporter permease subunit [Candidatus Eisenbacteria bacterium]|nr:ABC transporter permease subunit [Candidatus Latescibacterota bacterium]MBD3301872.1 ABC transporter permease subunit [Candidatus Eisenbacteria bacterium]
MNRIAICCALSFALLATDAVRGDASPVRAGSKAFAESWILAEACALLGRETGAEVGHRRNLGGTEIVYEALRSGEIDLYPEYTGTIAEVIVRADEPPGLEAMRRALAPHGIEIGAPLGFNNSYALAVLPGNRATDGITKISDLAGRDDLRLAFSHEFLGRKDGFPGLAARYDLPAGAARGIQHDLAYAAIASGEADVIDIYTTDAQIERLGLRILEDDRGFFPRYDAVLLYRSDLAERAPEALRAIRRLEGRIDEPMMIHANGRVVLDGESVGEAASWLVRSALAGAETEAPRAEGSATRILRNTAVHLKLVGISLFAAVLIGIPLGIAATRSRLLSATTLATAGIFQTIPSLALLAFLIPFLGIGPRPALVALFLYSLLPIVRNTATGLASIPAPLSESAEALGLSPAAQLFRIRLPLAAPAILAGVKTSAVINIGTATLAALIGAGGLGDPILQGIALRDDRLILQGALPAAGLALVAQGLFGLLDRVLVPSGLREEPRND